MQITNTRSATDRGAILNLGFRPFFALAALFSLLAMLAWTGVYFTEGKHAYLALPATLWHAHEMIYGYALAVIGGFLLTAVSNWTGIRTLHGYPLLLLGLPWLATRILLCTGTPAALPVAAVADIVYLGGLITAVTIPVIRAGQWRQLGILSKLVLILISNAVFYAGALGLLEDGRRLGLYSGLYLVIALIFVVGRRVMPFFIEKGAGYRVQLKNRPWLDVSSLVLFLAFWIAELVRPDSLPGAALAAALVILHAMRLAGWYTAGIWRKPLLWVLYVGYGWLICGFALKAAVVFAGVPPNLAVHAFAYGGIGMITVGMMSRVILGHTGRSVLEPPPVLSRVFALLLAGSVIRVLFPLFAAAHYPLWIGLSQALWVIAFGVFLYIYLPMLVRPRVDGQPG
jgi:uncharacterized protein involved in response to NO